MKKNKFIPAAIALVTAVASIAGCGRAVQSQSVPFQAAPSIAETAETILQSETALPDETTQPELQVSAVPEEVEALVAAMKEEDSKAVLDMCYLPENSVVSADDISHWIKRSSLAPFWGASGIDVADAFEEMGTISATLVNGSDQAGITMELNDDDNYALVLGDAFDEKTVRAPGGCEISINGVTLDEGKWAVKNQSTGYGDVLYQLVVPSRGFTAHIKSDLLGEYDSDAVWTEDKNWYNICPAMDDKTVEQVLSAIKENLNQAFALIEGGNVSVSDLEPYFSEDTPSSYIQTFIDWFGLSQHKDFGGDNQNIRISDLLADDRNGARIWLAASDRIMTNTRWKNSYVWYGEQYYTSDYAWFEVRMEDGTFKLTQYSNLTDNNLFTNTMRHEW